MSVLSIGAKQEFRKIVDKLHWINASAKHLPVDSSFVNRPRPIHSSIFARCVMAVLTRLVAFSPSALKLIDLESPTKEEPNEEWGNALAALLSGHCVPENAYPVAHCYCGRQFGQFAGQLGDGAAILLGEVAVPFTRNTSDSTQTRHRANIPTHLGLQLKGCGLTPFSREADGRKVLRSSLREFLCSEHMAALGIPTTRAAAIIVVRPSQPLTWRLSQRCETSTDRVERDMFYSGAPTMEPCSVVLRLAETFFRFGSFEIFLEEDPVTGLAGPSKNNKTLTVRLANYVIHMYYPKCLHIDGADQQYYQPSQTSEGLVVDTTLLTTFLPRSIYRHWFNCVVSLTAKLVAQWQLVGFCHGVLNTDNLSIIGDTLDYGPFGFVERYDPHFISNTSDKFGRYALSQQVSVCRWNCEKLAQALEPILGFQQSDRDRQELQRVLETHYDATFDAEYLKGMHQKLGLLNAIETDRDEDMRLIEDLLDVLRCTATDYTAAFLLLEQVTYDQSLNMPHKPNLVGLDRFTQAILDLCGDLEDLQRNAHVPTLGDIHHLERFASSLQGIPSSMLESQLGISAGCQRIYNDTIAFSQRLRRVLSGADNKRVYDAQRWKGWLEKWVLRLRRDAEADPEISSYTPRRLAVMRTANPCVILRNSLAERAIALAGSTAESRENREALDSIFEMLTTPFDRDRWLEIGTP